MTRARTMALLAVSLVFASLSAVLVILGERGWTPIVTGLLAFAGLVVGLAQVVGDDRLHRADTRIVPPVPPPSRESLLELEEPVRACPTCGGTELLVAVRGRGVSEAVECPRCGYLGDARTFWQKEEYARFVRGLAR